MFLPSDYQVCEVTCKGSSGWPPLLECRIDNATVICTEAAVWRSGLFLGAE